MRDRSPETDDVIDLMMDTVATLTDWRRWSDEVVSDDMSDATDLLLDALDRIVRRHGRGQ